MGRWERMGEVVVDKMRGITKRMYGQPEEEVAHDWGTGEPRRKTVEVYMENIPGKGNRFVSREHAYRADTGESTLVEEGEDYAPVEADAQGTMFRYTYGINFVVRNKVYSVTVRGWTGKHDDTALKEEVAQRAVDLVRDHVSAVSSGNKSRRWSTNELYWIDFGNEHWGEKPDYQTGYWGDGWQSVPDDDGAEGEIEEGQVVFIGDYE